MVKAFVNGLLKKKPEKDSKEEKKDNVPDELPPLVYEI